MSASPGSGSGSKPDGAAESGAGWRMRPMTGAEDLADLVRTLMHENPKMHENLKSGSSSIQNPDLVSSLQAPPGFQAPATPRFALEPDKVRQGLGKLVLALVELLRQLLEKQAVRRMEGGSLTDDEIERLGLTLMRLTEEIERLKGLFDLEGEELNLDLGPLGKLL